MLAVVAPAQAQTRRPVPGKPGTSKAGTSRPSASKPGPGKAPAPIEDARRVADDDRPTLFIQEMKLENPVLVFYQKGAPDNAVEQLLMSEKSLGLLKTMPLEELVARREVFIDGLGNYDPPRSSAEQQDKYRLAGVSQLATKEKRWPAPDGRSTYAKLKVPSPGKLYVVRESAEDYRHFVSGPQKKGSRIDFNVNGLPGVDSVRAAYTLRKVDASESGDVLR